MAIKPVLRLGDPRLLNVASQVEKFNTRELDTLITNMFDTMKAENGVGLAAPQIGVNLRVIVFGFDSNPRYPQADAVPESVLINPCITPLTATREPGWEGCLSVPGMRGMVSRYRRIRYSGYTATGDPVDTCADGFHARIVQHECDHLDGILYTQRLMDPMKFGFTEELLNAGLLDTVPVCEK